MSYRTNISAFLPNGPSNPLLNAYRILVAIELALKDIGCTGGHDIPSMLAQLANQHPTLAGQLVGHQSKLSTDLRQLTCNSPKGPPAAVLSNNYPHARYTRIAGDWNGVSETPLRAISALEQTCYSLLGHLQSHKNVFGINL